MSSEITHSSEQYAYVDKTSQTAGHPGITAKEVGMIEETTSADSNPAFYPRHNKSEALHNEAEKAGSEFPTGDPAAVAHGEDSDGESLSDEDVDSLSGGAPGHVPAGTGAGQEPGDADSPPGSQAAPEGNEPADDGAVKGDAAEDEPEYEAGSDEALVAAALERDVEGAKTYANNHPDRVDEMIRQEEAGRARVTLLNHLKGLQQG